MKLNHLAQERQRSQVIQQFGQAKLVKLTNGQHELIGGTDSDRTDAFEWVSLFAHEIVFTHFHRELALPCRTRKTLFSKRFYAVNNLGGRTTHRD